MELSNRELKFRVWNGASMEYNVTVGKFGNFYVNPENGNGLNPKDSASLTTCTTKYHESTPVMQYTGMKDSEGNEIYEGDIISHPEYFETPEMGNNPKQYGVVVFERCAFRMYDEALSPEDLENNDYFFVAGNIYENPELPIQG